MNNKNKFLIKIILCCIILSAYLYFIFHPATTDTIKVGILHSRTGTLAINEAPIISITLFAINEINNNGGIFGKQIEPILVDGKSDPEIFAKQAKFLINEKKVEVIFGCWTSAARKAVKEVVEEHDKLLFYPAEYMGLEESKNVIYMNVTANKQAIASLTWSINKIGKKLFLIGSDYAFPRAENEMIKDIAPGIGALIVGEEYIPLNSERFENVINKIEQTKPDVILSSISGPTNIEFFKKLNDLEKKGIKINIISFSLPENEFELLDLTNITNNYICTAYIQSIKSTNNLNFIKRFQAKFGYKKALNNPMISAYYGVNLWSLAVKRANTLKTQQVRSTIENIVYNGPAGIYQVAQNSNIWSQILLSKSDKQSKFDIEWESNIPIKPVNFPNDLFISKFIKNAKTKQDWLKFLDDLFKKWGNKWQ